MASLVDFAYYGALLLSSPALALKFGRPRGRRHLAGLRQRLGACRRRSSRRPCIWIHGVSVGEIVAAAPLIEALHTHLPDYEVVLSTTTSTGQQVAKKSYPGLRVIYYPLDFTWAVRRVLDAIRPDLVILVELEIWPNFLSEAYRRKIPVALVNGRISERSFSRYRYVRGWLFDPLGKVGRFCVQTERYADRFRQLGLPADQIYVTGSMKYDQLQLSQADGAEIRREIGIGASETVLIGGSTHPSEERALVEAYRALREATPDLRLVLVPRHTERAAEVARIVREAVGEPVLRSQQLEAREPTLPPGAVLLVDTIGELGRLYSAADVVFVGGSLIPHGGQNMLEPVAFGKPTVFGPHWDNFKEQVERLSAARGVREVKDAAELTQVLGEFLRNPEEARAMGARGRDALLAARGATERTLEVLRTYLRERTAQA
ncbi:MAG: 3-deoxy-D-manno-octulosonic acid transferase [Planctomycetes bacterium]|nr:3-deoxy-D-manno-octulosonic acid transferase [Planctomycetota bacterium]